MCIFLAFDEMGSTTCNNTAAQPAPRRRRRLSRVSPQALAACSTSDLIDRNARKGKGPSDHAPVIADFDLGTSS